MIFNAASSCWSGLSIHESVRRIVDGETYEPLLGVIASEHVQICPQHTEYLSKEVAQELVSLFPNTQFRLHADVRLRNKRGITIDLSDYTVDNAWYFKELASLSNVLNSKVYSLHAGARKVSLEELKEQHKRVQDIFGDITVAVEGLYPAPRDKWILSSWDEYAWLGESGIPFAIDLSHLKIVEKKYGQNDNLIKDLVSNKMCKEIHISFNDGNLDSHDIAQDNFLPIFNKYKDFLACKDENCVIFTEGNQVLFERRQRKLAENSI